MTGQKNRSVSRPLSWRALIWAVIVACWLSPAISLGARPPGADPGFDRTAVPPPPVAKPAPGGASVDSAPAVKYVAPGVFEVGGCRISKKESTVEFPASVNMQSGLLEYLLVGDAGKLHESLLRTKVEPYALQIALLLVGLEGSASPLGFQGEDKIPGGDPVEIRVRWKASGTGHLVRIEELVLLGKQPAPRMPWVFTGSIISNGVFAAQTEKSIIAVFHDPVAIFDHRLPSGANDEVWFVNTQATPVIGTPVTVVIRQASRN